MNKDEIQKVTKILLTADGGCIVCAAELVKKFAKDVNFEDGELSHIEDVVLADGWHSLKAILEE